MLPKLGKKVTHHFAHRTIVDCNGETYLHRLGKALFARSFLDCLAQGTSFTLSIQQQTRCTRLKDLAGLTCAFATPEYDLTKYYNLIEEEKSIEGFRADLLLSSTSSPNRSPLLIEIAVSHKCENSKTSSGLKILEVCVNNEEDLEPLKEGRLEETDGRIRLHGPWRREHYGDLCEGECPDPGYTRLFWTQRTGEASVGLIPRREIERFVSNEDVTYTRFVETDQSDWELHREQLRNALRLNVSIRDCNLCRFHRPPLGLQLGCAHLPRQDRVQANAAVKCDKFKSTDSHDGSADN
jgi:hypothetical protein